MNHQPEEHCHASHDNVDSIAQNTRRKRRDVEDVSSSPTNQASTLEDAPHIPIKSAQPRAVEQQRQGTCNKMPGNSQTDPTLISVPMISKPSNKPTSAPLNIVEKMKRTIMSFLMWDSLTMPDQLEFLQQGL